MHIINQQNTGTPGVIHTVNVQENTNYSLTINGYSLNKNNNVIVSTRRGGSLLENQFKNIILPTSRSNIVVYFNSKNNKTIFVGVCFKLNTSIGQEFSISNISMQKVNNNIISTQQNEINIHFNSSNTSSNRYFDGSPGDFSPSNFNTNNNETTTVQNNGENKEPVVQNIPQKIKNIEVDIFNLVESINEMNIDLHQTEKKLLKRIHENTKKSSE